MTISSSKDDSTDCKNYVTLPKLICLIFTLTTKSIQSDGITQINQRQYHVISDKLCKSHEK